MNIIEAIKKGNKKSSKDVKKNHKGFILQSDSQKVVIATLSSRNQKTGNMIQVWILVEGEKPSDAVKSGKDDIVCGGCKHRHFLGGGCYVNVGQAPNAIWKAYKRGVYSHIQDVPNWLEYFEGRAVRFGAYGDPAFIKLSIVKKIVSVAKKTTGYTHQWKDMPQVKPFFMASVDNDTEHLTAYKEGWRSFKVVDESYEMNEGEIVCPNTTNGISCADCGLCNGTKTKAKDIVILKHGSWAHRIETK